MRIAGRRRGAATPGPGDRLCAARIRCARARHAHGPLPEALLAIVCCVWLYLMETWRESDMAFYLVYVSVAIAYGLRMWPVRRALVAIGLVVLSTGGLTALDVARGSASATELVEVPLLSFFYLTMVVHVSSRQRMVQIVASTLRRERRLYAYATHELMTPLTVARGEVELLIRNGRPSDDALARAQTVVLEELRRSEQLTSDLLLAARISTRGVEREAIRADDLVLDAVERWSDRMPGPLRVGEVASGTLAGARDDLARALDNLLSNAARHLEAGGMARISSRADGGRLVISVLDDGSGIRPEDIPYVFDRFYRGDDDRRTGKTGSGLGLALVRDVVESHGGHASIESEPGRGTEVTLELPGFAPLDPRPRQTSIGVPAL